MEKELEHEMEAQFKFFRTRDTVLALALARWLTSGHVLRGFYCS